MSKTKKRLSLFSLSSSGEQKDNVDQPTQSNSPPNDPLLPPKQFNRSSSSLSTCGSTNAYAPESIFERSVQDSMILDPTSSVGAGPQPPLNKRSLSYSRKSSLSLKSGPFIKNEDYAAPCLDAASHLLNNKNSDLDNIEMIYSNRRNSSVVGLNMALGRPFTPSRKNSMYSIPQAVSQSTNQVNSGAATSPISPPKLNSSASAVSFYSYADMINHEDSRRPTFKSSYSQGVIPVLQSPSSSTGLNSLSGSLKSKNGRGRTASNAQKRGFLISPESSDEEKENVNKPQSSKLNQDITDVHDEENEEDSESFVSSSIGECLRKTRTELNSNER